MMDNIPVPKPRSIAPGRNIEAPKPLPRNLVPVLDKIENASASDILGTISTKSKQFTEGVAAKISNSAKGTLEKTKTTSRAVRDTVTKSVIEGTTAGMKLLMHKKNETTNKTLQEQRCASMPEGGVNLFENISFISPLQKRYISEHQRFDGEDTMCFTKFNDLSLDSSNSDSNTDSLSEIDPSLLGIGVDQNNMTYDTPRFSRTSSITSSISIPEVPETKKNLGSIKNRRNISYENYQLPTVLFEPGVAPGPAVVEGRPRPSHSTICEFDPLHTCPTSLSNNGISNELLLLESFLIRNTYGTAVSIDNSEDILEYVESDYFNPPSPPERFDSLVEMDQQDTAAAAPTQRQSNWYVTEGGKDDVPAMVEVKRTNSMMQKFSRKLKLNNVLHKAKVEVKLNDSEIKVVERPPISDLPAPYFSGTIMKTVAPGLVEELFKSGQSRYCVLSEQKLACYSDPTNGIVKEIYHLNTICCVQVVLPLSFRWVFFFFCIEYDTIC